MKILLISSYLPYPLFSGGQVRLYNLIKELSKKHEITLICEKRRHQTDADIHAVEKICKKVITVERRNQWSIKNIAKSVSSKNSFLLTGHVHKKMQEAIKHELSEHAFDLIHVETFYVMQNIVSSMKHKVSSMPPIVLVEHNIEYTVYQKFVHRVPVAIRPLLLLDIAKIKREEEIFWQQATKVVAVSEEDKKVMEKKGIAASVVSNGVNVDQFAFKKKEKKKEKKVLFIGDFSWIQNKDTATFIIKEIWPKIIANSKEQTAKLWIVGRNIPDSLRALTTDPSVVFDTESSQKQTPEIFQEADILLAPIRVGGGTSYKILESMSCGTPVVTMQMSADALHAKDGEHLMVGKTAQELAEKTVQLLTDEATFKQIASGGRALVEEKYTWKVIARALEEVYKDVTK